MKITIIQRSQLNGCWSPLQYNDVCHECDKIFTCKVKSEYHINGLKRKESIELDMIMKENEKRLDNLKANVSRTLKSITTKQN